MISDSNRMWASASFVGILIIIGLPLWWKTTEVYRVSLPYDKIAAFDPDSHVIATELVVLANDEATANRIAEKVAKAFEDSDILTLKITKSVLPPSLHQTLDAVADEYEATEEVASTFDLKSSNKFHLVQRQPLFQRVWVGHERVMFFRDEKAADTIISALKSWIYQPSTLLGARSEVADGARRLRFPPATGYYVVLSVVRGARGEQYAGGQKSIVQEAEVFSDYIGTFVDELSELHNFTLKSQFLYMVHHDFQAKEIPESPLGRHFSTRVERLQLLLTRIEERAATRVPELPAINLALYEVPCAVSPLLIYGEDDKPISTNVQAFMSPKWGGVVLTDGCGGGGAGGGLAASMGTFITQLRGLVGVVEPEPLPGAHMDPLRAVTPRRWEVDSLLRIRTLEQITSAQRTLQSLAQLLGEISNIVINDEVGASINLAVESTLAASSLARSGELAEAYRRSQTAQTAAETAFMEPSLLALLYFPDDQKYAIYIPLFLPIMFPVVLSLKNLITWLRGKTQKEKVE